MIIKDVNGGKLQLSKDRLEEVSGELYPPIKYHVLLKDVNRAKNRIKLRRVGSKGFTVAFVPQGFTIGCREFSPATFAKILKAAGVKTRKPAKRKK
jgi:hypothetical protein